MKAVYIKSSLIATKIFLSTTLKLFPSACFVCCSYCMLLNTLFNLPRLTPVDTDPGKHYPSLCSLDFPSPSEPRLVARTFPAAIPLNPYLVPASLRAPHIRVTRIITPCLKTGTCTPISLTRQWHPLQRLLAHFIKSTNHAEVIPPKGQCTTATGRG